MAPVLTHRRSNPALFTALISVCLLLTQAAAPGNAAEGSLSFTILHTNDLHSHEEPFRDNGRIIGGLARIANIIKQDKASAKKPLLVVDAGDIFQGTPFFEQYHGEIEVECLNKMGYDIFTIGNHEFDDGSENLGEQLSKAKFDVVSSNLDVSPNAKLTKVVKPSVVKTIGGEKVAFIGAMTPSLSALANKLDGVKLKAVGDKWYEPIQQEVQRLKAEGINKFIVVAHVGVDGEKQLAEAVPEIDVIIGGHSHTRLEKPVLIKHADGSQCVDVQTGCYGRALGRLDLTFDDKGQVVVPQTRYRLINITDKLPEDQELKSYIEEKGKPFAYLKTTLVGNAESNFDNRFAKYPYDSPIGDLVCDALAAAGAEFGATISMQNRGGLRAKIERGPIYLEKVREVLPFDNRLVIATITGASLLKNLENSVSGMLGARFLDVSGLKIAYDRSREQGKRVVFALAKDSDGKWQPVDPAKTYRIALNSYSFSGGEGYEFPDAKDVVETGKRTSVFLQSFLEKNKSVSPRTPDRLVEVADVISTNKTDLVVKVPTGAEVSLVGGNAKGVDFLKKLGTVPVSSPVILKSAKASDKGNFSVPLAQLNKKDGNRFVTAVIKSTDKDGTHTVVSYPIELAPALTQK